MSATVFEILKVQAWIREAGVLAINYYQQQLTRQRKADNSPVTEADYIVEKFLIDQIQKNYQDHTIIGEESGENWQQSEFVWAIDPIDGTRVFADGLPLWSISIGLLRNGQPYRGIVYLPVLDEIYYTDDQGQAFWNDIPIKGMLRTGWDRDSFIGVSSGAHRYFDINFRRIRALGAIATHHVYVARGVAVAALHRQSKIWDVAGAQAILESVGGIAVYLDGSPVSIPDMLVQRTARGPILVGHPEVVQKLLPLIKIRINPGDIS